MHRWEMKGARKETKGAWFPSSWFQLNIHFSESLPHPLRPHRVQLWSSVEVLSDETMGHMCLLKPWLVMIAAEKKNMQKERLRTHWEAVSPKQLWWVNWTRIRDMWIIFLYKFRTKRESAWQSMILRSVWTWSVSQLVLQVMPNPKCHQALP